MRIVDLPEVQLTLFRHAEAETNLSPTLIAGRSNHAPLTEEGVLQARRLGSLMKERGLVPDLVFSSPAVRTLETAKYAFEAMGMRPEIVESPELQEMDMGEWTNRTWADVLSDDEVLAQVRREGDDFVYPGGESRNQAGDRMLSWVTNSLASVSRIGNRPARVVGFTHGDALRSLFSEFEGPLYKKGHSIYVAKTSATRLTRSAPYAVRFMRPDVPAGAGAWALDYVVGLPSIED